MSQQQRREFAWRAKLIVGLCVLGVIFGGGAGVWLLAREAGFDALDVPLPELAGWVAEAARRGFGGELFARAAGGAALFAGLPLLFFIRGQLARFFKLFFLTNGDKK